MDKKYIIGLISSLREKYTDYLNQELEREGLKELVPLHGAILSVLYKHENPIPILEIAAKVGRTKSTVSELIQKLAGYGLIEKQHCQIDKRVCFVALTEKGKSIQKTFEQISERLIIKACQGFSDTELESLIEGLIKMKKNF